MKSTKTLTYLIYTIFLFGSLLVSTWATFMIKVWIGRTYRPIPGVLGYILISIILGIILGLEHLVLEFRKEGRWSVNKTRLIIMGIPAGIFAFYLFFAYLFGITLPFLTVIYNSNLFTQFSGLIFGYIVVTSFSKYQRFLPSALHIKDDEEKVV